MSFKCFMQMMGQGSDDVDDDDAHYKMQNMTDTCLIQATLSLPPHAMVFNPMSPL